MNSGQLLKGTHANPHAREKIQIKGLAENSDELM